MSSPAISQEPYSPPPPTFEFVWVYVVWLVNLQNTLGGGRGPSCEGLGLHGPCNDGLSRDPFSLGESHLH